jgi:hypothetical protein
LDMKTVDSGFNIVLIERAGASTLFRHVPPGLPGWLASPFIQYLDLLDGRGRHKELAQHLRTNILQI